MILLNDIVYLIIFNEFYHIERTNYMIYTNFRHGKFPI